MRVRRSMGGGWLRAHALGAACALAALPAAAQSDGAVRPGQVSERVTAQMDSAHSYALFTPSSYAPDRTWPALYVMDPRGRALAALDRFRPAAEELGWIVASSYDSRSDVPEDLNTPAFNAMLDDTQRRVRLDTRRLYLAGFSGTAQSSWYIALAMAGNVAGIVVAGYGLPIEAAARLRDPDTPPAFAVYGTAGRTGFNYEDVWAMDGALDDAGLAHRIAYFDGGHEWMPPDLAGDALRWLELRAMLTGLRPLDREFVAARYSALMDRANDLVVTGRELEAAKLLGEAPHDFEVAREQIARARTTIEGTEGYREQVRRRAAESSEASGYSDLLRARFGGRSGEGPRVAPDDLARELRVDELLRRAAAGDPPDAVQARRLLASASVLLGFYGPRAALAKRSPGHALDYLEVAARIEPENPSHCRLRAFAQAQRGDLSAALAALRCWTRAAAPPPEALRSEPYLEPLRGDPGFEALLRELGGW